MNGGSDADKRMTTRYWFDTCVWRDFFEERTGIGGSSLGKYAAEAFTKVISRKDKILCSESLTRELKKNYDESEIIEMLNLLFFINILIIIEIDEEEQIEASLLSEKRGLPFIDCLNAVQARNHDAIVISQDRHFLNDLQDIAKSIRPQDL